MRPAFVLLARDIRLAVRAGGGAALALAFFAAVVTLIPLGIGPDPGLLSRIAAGMLWIAAVLAALLALDRLFQADFEDGSLDLIALSPVPLELVALAKIAAHWLTTGLPLTAFSPVLGLLLGLPEKSLPWLVLSLALGTPAVSALGTIGAALTIPIRRGGLILPLIVLPLLVPIVLSGTALVLAAADGISNGAGLFLAALSLISVTLAPFVAAAAVRIHLGD